ncbi:hypothetical protein BH09GEM1_BH09GEM1_30030 [soil metagenome]
MIEKVTSAFGGADASTKAFAHKLSRKLGWRPAFAFRAIEEYKRFLYLGIVSESVVTPSLIIDQVWHEHLLFSRGYREFCRDVLQRDFDHNPELVPSDTQTAVFKAQFDATVDLYHEEFNVEPPPQIWGETKFSADAALAGATPRRKGSDITATPDASDAPLYTLLGSDGSGNSDGGTFDFGGGGGFSGGGGGSDWGGSSDSTDSGGSSDGGSSCGGGSSCSSGCGGGE